MFREAFFLLLLALAAAAGSHFWHPAAPAWYAVNEPLAEDEIDPSAVEARWQGKVIWFDARPRDQFEQGHIPGALLLNEQEFDDLLFTHLEVLERSKSDSTPIIIYCSGQACKASRAVKEALLQRVPLDQVFVLRGGWPAWQAAGGAVER